MVSALIAAVGLMVCQKLSTFDGGVAKIEEGPQYIVGDTTLCTRRTVLSPDGSKPLDLTPLTDRQIEVLRRLSDGQPIRRSPSNSVSPRRR